MSGDPSSSSLIEALGVTSVPTLLACPLSLSTRRSGSGGGGESGPQATLGDVCHAALEIFVKSGGVEDEEWPARLEVAWAEAAEDAGAAQIAALPGARTARARLTNTARRLQELLATAGEPRELVCETSMSALEGRLIGRPDLVIRSSDAHWIVDYKTGSVFSEGVDAPREAYVSQLQLYGVLEKADSGSWPDAGYLLPLAERPVKVPLNAADCEAAAERFIADLDRYNKRVPASQPAQPSADACRWCDHIADCDAPWSACDESWASDLLIATGTVAQCTPNALGTATIVIDVDGGTIAPGRVAITGASATDHPAMPSLEPGARIRVARLRRARGEATYALPAWGVLGVVE